LLQIFTIVPIFVRVAKFRGKRPKNLRNYALNKKIGVKHNSRKSGRKSAMYRTVT